METAGNVPGSTACARERDVALLQDDIMHVTTICKSDGISRN
jgi:hypothetical protein